MSCNYILPERDDIVSLVFQTEPGRKYTDVHVTIRYQNSYDVLKILFGLYQFFNASMRDAIFLTLSALLNPAIGIIISFNIIFFKIFTYLDFNHFKRQNS